MLQLYRNILDSVAAQYTGTVNLDGETITDAKPAVAGTSKAAFRVNTDGTIDKRTGGSYSQIDAGSDWITPPGGAESSFEVKIEENSCSDCGSSTFASPAGASKGTGTWYDLSSAREWRMEKSSSGIADWDVTLHIRYGSSGNAIDTGVYNLLAGWTD